MDFLTPVDIANRALQHCGARLIDATQGFTEDSKNATETAFAYGKLRRAELRRNVWRFATRKAVIRPIATTTMLLTPSLWVESTTYFLGSIVSDETGVAWISRIPNNLGWQPQNSLNWEPYFGPLTVSLYDSGESYNSGELVYTAAGDGTNRVFFSLQSGNEDNPATATAWSATDTYQKDTIVTYLTVPYLSLIDLNTNQQPDLAPALWSAGTAYGIGDPVGASDGVIYTSVTAGNTGNDPVADDGTNWTNTGDRKSVV